MVASSECVFCVVCARFPATAISPPALAGDRAQQLLLTRLEVRVDILPVQGEESTLGSPPLYSCMQ